MHHPKWWLVGHFVHPHTFIPGFIVSSLATAVNYGKLAGGAPPILSWEFFGLAWTIIPASIAVPAAWFYEYHRPRSRFLLKRFAIALAFTTLFTIPILLNGLSHGLYGIGYEEASELAFNNRYFLFGLLGWPTKLFLLFFFPWLLIGFLPSYVHKKVCAWWARRTRARPS
ncbi:MAG TPA: hypothetical protein VJG29_02370 [Candidatus Paceibacterota bacterium]